MADTARRRGGQSPKPKVQSLKSRVQWEDLEHPLDALRLFAGGIIDCSRVNLAQAAASANQRFYHEQGQHSGHGPMEAVHAQLSRGGSRRRGAQVLQGEPDLGETLPQRTEGRSEKG